MKSRRTGFSLVIIGLLGIAYFWITDPYYGLALHWSHGDNPIDYARDLWVGTALGVVASLLVLLIGLYMLARRAM